MMAGGLLVETVADVQKSLFKKKAPGSFCTRYTACPVRALALPCSQMILAALGVLQREPRPAVLFVSSYVVLDVSDNQPLNIVPLRFNGPTFCGQSTEALGRALWTRAGPGFEHISKSIVSIFR